MKSVLVNIAFISVILFATNCKPKDSKHFLRPDKDVIARDSMVSIIADFQVVESAIRFNMKFGINTEVFAKFYYSGVLEQHKITKEQFDHSMAFYSQSPDDLEEIFNGVIAKLSEKQTAESTE